MAEATKYMEQLGVSPALFKKWQAEGPEDDEPAPFPTCQDALILAQRGQNTTAPRAIEEEPGVGNLGHHRADQQLHDLFSETVQNTARSTDVEAKEMRVRMHAGRG